MTIETPDADHDGQFEALVVHATLAVPAPGEWKASAVIPVGYREGSVILGAIGPEAERSEVPFVPVNAGADGLARVTARFDGEEIRRLAARGKQHVTFHLMSGMRAGPRFEGREYVGITAPIDPLRFGTRAAHVGAVSWLDEGAGRLNVGVGVARPGNLTIEANAWVDSTLVGHVSEPIAGGRGMRAILLTLAPVNAGAPAHAKAGPTRVEVRIYEGTEPGDAWEGTPGRAAAPHR